MVRHQVSRDREKEENVGELADVTGVRYMAAADPMVLSAPDDPTRQTVDPPTRSESCSSQPMCSATSGGKPPVATGPQLVGVIRISDLSWSAIACLYSSQLGCSPAIERK